MQPLFQSFLGCDKLPGKKKSKEITCPIYKRGSRADAKSYKSISLKS